MDAVDGKFSHVDLFSLFESHAIDCYLQIEP